MIGFCIFLFLLIATLYIIYILPSPLIRYFRHRWPDVLWHVLTPKKLMALTIDDGPSRYTNEILQILKANNAAATFFIIGSQVAGREDALPDLIRNNNELANHAMHDEPSRLLPDAELTKQIQAVHNTIHQAYADKGIVAPPKYFRPDSGFFGTRMRKILSELDCRLVLGDVYPHDAQIRFWHVNARHILSMLRPRGIIICHDRRSWMVPVLRRTIPEINRRGYRLTSHCHGFTQTRRLDHMMAIQPAEGNQMSIRVWLTGESAARLLSKQRELCYQ